MGISRFFRWVSERFPLILEQINEEQIPEFDCLYLDMNGIIHNCSHANGGLEHETEEDIWEMVFNYINHLVYIIKPRKMLYMAVDGVAPRAKMNQQRSRRFRSAHDAAEAREKADTIKKEQFKRGISAPSRKKLVFDTNCITPGTEFMYRLSEHMDFLIKKKMHEDPLWKDIKVILSGPGTPGEGEHKIMEYIRAAKTQPDYQPNLRHCIYGLDADLIMLSLASHEPHFSLLREEVIFDKAKSRDASSRVLTKTDSFQLLHIGLYREYLGLEILEGSAPICRPPLTCGEEGKRHPSTAFFDELAHDGRLSRSECMERVVDDFILFCFMIGNDFLPHLHFAEIGEGGLSQLIKLYKSHLREVGLHESSFIAKDEGEINWKTFFKLFGKWSRFESEKLTEHVASKEWLNTNYKTLGKNKNLFSPDYRASPTELLHGPGARDLTRMNSSVSPLSAPAGSGGNVGDWNNPSTKKKSKHGVKGSFMSLTEAKRDWYQVKMGMDVAEADGQTQLSKMIEEYLRGLQWVLHYYFKGVPSWDWFYPFHYSPWADDIMQSEFALKPDFKVTFELGTPFLPFQQLMSVMPPECANLLPPLFHPLMREPRSPIKDFYPETVQIDMEGVKVEWGGTILVPFIQSNRLVSAMDEAISDADRPGSKNESHRLSDRDRMRNRNTSPFIYWRDDSTPAAPIVSTLPSKFPSLPTANIVRQIYHLPTIPKGVRANVRLPATFSSLPGFPSLHSLRVRPRHGQGVKQFQFESKSDSLFLSASTWDKMSSEAFTALIESPVIHVDWPYVHLAQLEALVFPHFILKFVATANDGEIEIDAMNSTQGHSKVYDDMCSALHKRGIIVAEAASYNPEVRAAEMAAATDRKLQSFFDSDVEDIESADEEEVEDDEDEVILVKKHVSKPLKFNRKSSSSTKQESNGKHASPAELFAPIDLQREKDEHNVAAVNMYGVGKDAIHPVLEKAVRQHVLSKVPNFHCAAAKVVAVVRAVSSLGVDEKTGAIKKTLSAESRTYPLAHLMPMSIEDLPKWETYKSHSLQQSIRNGAEVLILGSRQTLFGTKGTVKAVKGASVDLEVVCTTAQNEIGGDFEKIPMMIQERVKQSLNKAIASEQWFSFKEIAQKLEIPEGTVRMISGQFFVNEVRSDSGFPGKENLGLNFILFHGVNAPLVAPGFCRARWRAFADGSGRWEADLSKSAVEAFELFKQSYPNVFTAVNGMSSQSNGRDGGGSNFKKSLSAKQLFSGSTDPNYELGQVSGWLSKQKFRQARLVPGTHCVVAPTAGLNEVERVIDNARSMARNASGNNEIHEIVYNVTLPIADLRPTTSTAPLPESLIIPEPCIGQRVVYARGEGSIPVGSRATVVGILGAKRVRSNDGKGSGGRVKELTANALDESTTPNGNEGNNKQGPVLPDEIEVMVELVLDSPFLGADSLFGRTSARRGLIVSPDDIIPLFPRINKNGAYDGKDGLLPEGTKKSVRTVSLKNIPVARDLLAECGETSDAASKPVVSQQPVSISAENEDEEEIVLVTTKSKSLGLRANSKQSQPNTGISEGVLSGFGVIPNKKPTVLENLFNNQKNQKKSNDLNDDNTSRANTGKRWNVPLNSSQVTASQNAPITSANERTTQLLKDKLNIINQGNNAVDKDINNASNIGKDSNNTEVTAKTEIVKPSIPTQIPIEIKATSVPLHQGANPVPPKRNAQPPATQTETTATSGNKNTATPSGKNLLAMLKSAKKDNEHQQQQQNKPTIPPPSAPEILMPNVIPPPPMPALDPAVAMSLNFPPLVPPLPPFPGIFVPVVPSTVSSPFANSSAVIIIPPGVQAVYANGLPAVPLGVKAEEIQWASNFDYKNPQAVTLSNGIHVVPTPPEQLLEDKSEDEIKN